MWTWTWILVFLSSLGFEYLIERNFKILTLIKHNERAEGYELENHTGVCLNWTDSHGLQCNNTGDEIGDEDFRVTICKATYDVLTEVRRKLLLFSINVQLQSGPSKVSNLAPLVAGI